MTELSLLWNVGAAVGVALGYIAIYWLLSRSSMFRSGLVNGEAKLEGQRGRVVSWSGSDRYVRVSGELWKASSTDLLTPGDWAVVQKVNGLVLVVVATERP